MGLPFFAPMFNPRAEIVIHCPEIAGGQFSQQALEALFLPPYSPITLQGIKARLSFQPLAATAPGKIRPSGCRHRGRPHQARFASRGWACSSTGSAHGGKRVVYATDVESPDGFDAGISAFHRTAPTC